MQWMGLFKETAGAFMAHKAMRLSAALAYYSVFSLAPLLMVAISIAGAFFGDQATRGAVESELAGAIGRDAARTLQEMLVGVSREGEGGGMALVGSGILLVSASGVFVQLKDAMNAVWGIRPKAGRGFFAMVRDRLLSLTMVLGIGFLLLITLLLSTAVSVATDWLGGPPPVHPFLVLLANGAVSLAVVTVLFAVIFKILPDAEIEWRDVWEGAFITSCLFGLGKSLLAIYLVKWSGPSAYGAAGALILVLTWVYYSANILLFGAEFTQVLAGSRGRRIVPTALGEWASDASDR